MNATPGLGAYISRERGVYKNVKAEKIIDLLCTHGDAWGMGVPVYVKGTIPTTPTNSRPPVHTCLQVGVYMHEYTHLYKLNVHV